MLDQLFSELKGNLRLRIGVALILAVLWLYLILVMRETLDDSRREFRNSSLKLGKLQSVMREGDWSERLTAAKTLQAELESGLWRGDTLGLARASFQDWLNQQIQIAAVPRPSISMGGRNEGTPGDETQPGDAEGLWHVRAKLVFDFNPESLNKLLAQLASHPHHVAIESLHITKEPFPRVELLASAHFQKPDNLTAPETGK